MRLNGGSPIGIFRGDDIVINPSEDYCLRDTDKVVVLSETRESARLEAASDPMQSPDQMLRSDLIQSSVQNVDGIPRIIMDQEESKETAIMNCFRP